MDTISMLFTCLLFVIYHLSTSSSEGDDTVDGPVSPIAMKKSFYEELVFSWIIAHPATRAIVYANAWFFFEILVSEVLVLINGTMIWKLTHQKVPMSVSLTTHSSNRVELLIKRHKVMEEIYVSYDK